MLSCANYDDKSNRKNSSDARYMINKEKRAPNLGHNGWRKRTQIDANIECLAVMLSHHKVCGDKLIKMELLN